MAIYAFDGTGNKNKKDDAKDTNVRKFYEAYAEAYTPQVKTIMTGRKGKKRKRPVKSKCIYIKGVGTSKLPIRKMAGLLFGAGGKARVRKAMKALRENVKLGDTTIDVVGFSRGAAESIEFVNRIRNATIGGKKGRAVRFLGIWDTVASFGIPDLPRPWLPAQALRAAAYPDSKAPCAKDRLAPVWLGVLQPPPSNHQSPSLSHATIFHQATRPASRLQASHERKQRSRCDPSLPGQGHRQACPSSTERPSTV